MQICWRARTWACGRFWSNSSGISTKTWVTVTPNHDGSQSAAHSLCDIRATSASQWAFISATSKKAISVTALDKQQNQHRGKRNRQNMYTQIRSIWSWRYWDISVLYVLFGLFLKNSKSLEGKQSQAGYQIATEISWNFKKGKSQWAQEYCISYHQKLNACLRKKNTTLLDSSIRTVGDYKEKPEPTQSRLWPGNCILRRSIRQHLTSR